MDKMDKRIIIVGLFAAMLIVCAGGVMGKTVVSTTSDGSDEESFVRGEKVYVKGYNFDESTVMDVYIFPNRQWFIHDPIPTDYKGNITVTSNSSGDFGPDEIWTADEVGYYDILVDVNRNGEYDGKDKIRSKSPQVWAFEVVPEADTIVLMGAGLLSMIGYMGMRRA